MCWISGLVIKRYYLKVKGGGSVCQAWGVVGHRFNHLSYHLAKFNPLDLETMISSAYYL